MKKFFIILLSLIVLIFLAVYILLFTGVGNNILKPIIEKKASQASGIEIKLDKFSLRLSSIDVEATVAQNLKAKVNGNMSIFSQSFDLIYDINADEIPEIEGIKIDGQAKLNGKVYGKVSDFAADGQGEIFDSSINFDTKIKDYKPINAVADISNLEIAKILALLGQPVYSSGVVFLKADIVPNDKNELSGTALVKVDKGLINEDVMLKEFNVTLPKNTNYNVVGNFNIENSNNLVGKIDILSSLATLKTSKTTYDIKGAKLFSDFNFDIADLSKFSGIANMPLNGKINLFGNAAYAQNDLNVNVLSDNLAGGKLNLNMNNDKLNANLKGVKLEEVFKTLVMPNYSNADIDVTADIDSIKALKGQASVIINNGVINSDAIKKEFNQTLPKNINYNVGANAILDNNKVNFSTKLLSTLANINDFSGTYDINKTNLESKYTLDVPDLSKFSEITGQKINGSLSLNGIANYVNNVLHVKANSDNFANGKINVELEGDTLIASVDKAKLEQILAVAAQPIFASGEINAKVNLTSIAKKDGTIALDVSNGLLNEETLKKEFNVTIPKTNYSVNANVNMKDAKAEFNSKVLSTLLNLNDFSGTFDINEFALDSKYQVQIDDLSKLNSITNQKMIGKIALDGTAKLSNNVLHVDGKSNLANGTVNFDFNDGKLVANGNSLSTVELLKMLSYPDIFIANIDAKFNYNTKTSSGDFSAVSPRGQLKQNQLGLLIEPLLKLDITKEVYEDIKVIGDINKELIHLDFDMTSENTYFKVVKGKINAGILNIPLALKIKNRDFKATISGPSDNIKVSLDSSQYLKDKISETLSDNKTQQTIKDFLKKL